MIDHGFRSLDSSLRVLTAVIAVEVLFSRSDLPGAQTTAIARRIAFLTCGGGCGTPAPHCPYTEKAKGHKALLLDLEAIAAKGQGWQCSAFLHIAAPVGAVGSLRYAPLFSARNAVAHEDVSNFQKQELSHLIRVADEAICAGLEWFAKNPASSMAELDREIGGTAPPDPVE